MKFIIYSVIILGLIGFSAHAQEEPQLNFFQNYANQFDSYLAGEEIEARANDTRLTIGHRVIWQEGGEWDNKPYVDFKLQLPKFSKKWKLRFTSYDEDQEEIGLNASDPKTEQREEEAGLSLFFLEKIDDINVTFRPRIDGDGTNYVLKFRRLSNFWMLDFNPKLEFFLDAERGTGQFLGLNLGYKINNNWYYLLINENQYTDIDNTFATNQGFSFRQVINPEMTQSYTLVCRSNNQPQHYRLMQYIASFRFEHKVPDSHVIYRITPFLDHERDFDFESNPGVTFELEFVF